MNMYKTFPNQGQRMGKTHPNSFFMSGRSEFPPMSFLFGNRPTIKGEGVKQDVEVLQICLSRDNVMAEVVRKSYLNSSDTVEFEKNMDGDSTIMRHTHPKSFFMCGRTELKPMHFLLDEKPTIMANGETYPVVVLQCCMSREYTLAEVVRASDYYGEEPIFVMGEEETEDHGEDALSNSDVGSKLASFFSKSILKG